MLTAVLLIAAFWTAVAVFAIVATGIDEWRRESECGKQGNLWDPAEGCLVRMDECVTGSRRIPAGAVFGEGCYACECRPYGGVRCRTGPLCDLAAEHCDPSRGTCVFDPGCVAPQAFHAAYVSASFSTRAYCGCDGQTFVSAVPTKAYQHVGACSNESR
jgi:hypothetical protein